MVQGLTVITFEGVLVRDPYSVKIGIELLGGNPCPPLLEALLVYGRGVDIHVVDRRQGPAARDDNLQDFNLDRVTNVESRSLVGEGRVDVIPIRPDECGVALGGV